MQEKAYGIIPFYRGDKGLEVFLIHQYGSGGGTHWTFPKGRPEEGESPLETALREFTEETGMFLASYDDTRPFSTSYSFMRNNVQIEKTSIYFIGYVDTKNFTIQPEEIKEAGWFDIEEARAQLTFPYTKTLFEEVLHNLDNS